MTKIKIEGNTYPVKEQLRNLGCRWDSGDKCWWTDSDEIASKAKAIVSPHPIYNSPPPADLGTTDPVASASKFGRKAIAGATVKSFTVTGLGKGDNGKPDGAIRRVKGVRYVQIARTPRRYLSRDWLEDMDMFNSEPGGSYQWDGVAVEPTQEEIAADATEQEKKDQPVRAAKALGGLVDGLAKVADRPSWCTTDKRIATWTKPNMIHTGSYSMLYRDGDTLCYYAPGYFACDWDYPPVIRVGPCPAELEAILTEARQAKLIE